jgi:6-pyruvoyl-tetrahydropterin synthase
VLWLGIPVLQVDAEIQGQLTDRGLVIDFLLAKPIVRNLCDGLDEHWLVPGKHPELVVTALEDGHTEVSYRDASYLAPTKEIQVLPINNISAENLATWIGRELRKSITERFGRTQIDKQLTTGGRNGVTSVVVACHGGTVGVILSLVLELQTHSLLDATPFASITRLVANEGAVRVRTLHEVSHFDGVRERAVGPEGEGFPPA